MDSVLIVGSGLAGLSAARAARTLGFTGRLTLLAAEAQRPYDRPPLSKDYLAGTTGRADLALESANEDLGLGWRHDTAVSLTVEPAGPVVTTAAGEVVAADGVVLATGAAARRLPEPNFESAPGNLLTLRTVADADRLRSELGPDRRLVVVGAGLIGSEVASTAAQFGCAVTLLTPESNPLAGLYGEQLAPYLARWPERNGVELVREAKISSFEVAAGRVRAVTLADGRVLPADVVLVAIGGEPLIGWLQTSPLDLGDGVHCDRAGRALADGLPVPGLVAVGDCAAWFDPHLLRHHRAQHWTDALERPMLAVAALLGVAPPRRRPYLPYFWSDQFGHRIQMAGYASLADTVRVEVGDPAHGEFVAVYRRAAEPVAVLAVSTPREFTRWRKLLTASLGHLPDQPTAPSLTAPPAAAGPRPTVPDLTTPHLDTPHLDTPQESR